MWSKAQFVELMVKKSVAIGIASALSAGIGAAGGFLFAKKKYELKYEQIAKQEIEDSKEFYKRLNKVGDDGETLTPEEVMEQRHGRAAIDALRVYQGTPLPDEIVIVDPEESAAYLEQVEGRVIDHAEIQSMSLTADGLGKVEIVKRNIFTDAQNDQNYVDDNFDYEIELASRSEDAPYVISHDEFFQNELDYEQVSLTYYEGDGVLLDDKDMPIPDTDDIVGDDNLVRFGHGSKDNNIVYVRNDHRSMDFEIARSTGEYAVDVLGFDENTNKSGVRKFRGHDD